MERFLHFKGTLTMIQDFVAGPNGESTGCYKLMSVINDDGVLVNFVVAPNTYFVDHEMVSLGHIITGFYDANVPVPLIYPPQYRAVVIAKYNPDYNVKVDFFNNELISSDNMLKLNIAPYTEIVLENDQLFTQNPGNRNLIVLYGPTTKSIPAQTSPYKIIVMC